MLESAALASDLFDAAPRRHDAVSHAYAQGLDATRRLSRDEQKRLGQFMTPAPIARRMAARALRGWRGRCLRILDPAAGSGVLAAAAVEAALALPEPPLRIALAMHEIDERLEARLDRLGAELTALARSRDVTLDYRIALDDFLLCDLARAGVPCVDLVVANPPYFKLRKNDPRARTHGCAVHGQPNIYALFMAACASLVRPGGRWAFITPRSWTSGDYFAAMRRHLFARLDLVALHVFDSRTAHFADDEVLQEALVSWAQAGAGVADVECTLSEGSDDLDDARTVHAARTSVIGNGASMSVSLPFADAGIERWRGRLSDHGWAVRTGPVVAFRARRWLGPEPGANTVPLLWMQHVRRAGPQWPLQRKLEHLRRCDETEWMLVPNRPMVLMRRFSPKEELRRITACAWLHDLPHAAIGLENHLNYIAAAAGSMSADEACGLAAYLGSEPVDIWLRQNCGHTQVNATDLRRLPIPGRDALHTLGREVGRDADLGAVDAAVRALTADHAG